MTHVRIKESQAWEVCYSHLLFEGTLEFSQLHVCILRSPETKMYLNKAGQTRIMALPIFVKDNKIDFKKKKTKILCGKTLVDQHTITRVMIVI